jgi:hypothetical protein
MDGATVLEASFLAASKTLKARISLSPRARRGPAPHIILDTAVADGVRALVFREAREILAKSVAEYFTVCVCAKPGATEL